MKTVSHEEFLKLKAEAAIQQAFSKTPIIELEIGKRYIAANYDLIIVKSIDVENDKLHIFNFTQQCNVYPRLSTYIVKNKL